MQRNVQYIKFQLNFSLVNVPYTCWVLIDISVHSYVQVQHNLYITLYILSCTYNIVKHFHALFVNVCWYFKR